MSLLILIQKVLYLVLLITLLYGLTSADQHINIYVQQDGIDQSECMKGNVSIPCHTLSYVLNRISSIHGVFQSTNISVYVYITYYQEMTNLPQIWLVVNLYLIGVDNPVLDFSVNRYEFTGNLSPLIHPQCSFYAENIIFYQFFMSFMYLLTVSFNNCIFTDGGRPLTYMESLFIGDSYTVIINNSLVWNNRKQSELIIIENVVHVNISGCELYQNKGQSGLVSITPKNRVTPFVFVLDNCRIYDNDVSLSTIDVYSYNSTSAVIVRNCRFSNNTSGQQILRITINRLYMSNIDLTSNKIKKIGYSIIDIGLIPLQCNEQYFNISNTNFINNTGTALKLVDVIVYFNNIIFYNNTGVYGGGMSLDHTRIYLTGPLRFERNKALIGGAIYIPSNKWYDFDTPCSTLEQIAFSNNTAGMLADDIFIENGPATWFIPFVVFPCIDKTKTSDDVRGDHIITNPCNVIINPQSNSTITLFPGQKLTYSANVTDYFGNLTSCSINILLECGDHLIFCKYVQLTGDAASLLSTDNITTNLYLTSTAEHHDSSINYKLRFVCLNTNTEAYANVNLTTCPLGYVFQTPQKSQSIQGTCECVDTASNDVECDFMLGVACIRHGYWLGNINADNVLNATLNDTAPCQYPYCKTDLPPCPIIGLAQTYNQLPVTRDEQCNGLYGRLLCRGCREGAVFSFEAVKCIPSSNCQPWQPYVTLVLATIFQLVLGFVIIIGLKASFKTGIGHLYGPLFFIAVLRLIPFGYYKEYVQLNFTTSIFQSILLLNLEIFGEIPWCFFSNINPLLNYSLHFVGPFIIAVVLLSTVLLARYYPRQFLSLQSSPIQAICLLILLSFWSVSDTCIQLLKPTTTLSGVKEWRVALQPNIQYLKDPYHIVTWIISIFLLVFLIIPFILLLFLSPLLRRKFNLTRIQPLLDAFQSCFDDKFRWYSGVYLLSWIILNIYMPYYVIQIILVAVGTLHFMIHPYKYRWLNIADTLLLVDLNMLAFLTSVDSSNSIHNETVIISYILVVLPLTYITIGGVWIISVIIIKWCKRKMCTDKITNEEETVNLLELVDSGDENNRIGVNSTVVERPVDLVEDEEDEEEVDSGNISVGPGVVSTLGPVCRREDLIFYDN